MKKNPFIFLFIALSFLVVSAAHSASTTIQMDQGKLYSNGYGLNGMGSGRGVGITTSTNFHMNSLGVDVSVLAGATLMLFEFEIFSSTDGHSAGSLLDRKEFYLNSGAGWQDISFDYDFLANRSYVINFSRADNIIFGPSMGIHYSWEPSAYVNYGPFSVVEGFEGASPSASNPLVPHMRMNIGAVPVPASMLLLSVGLLGLAGRARKK